MGGGTSDMHVEAQQRVIAGLWAEAKAASVVAETAKLPAVLKADKAWGPQADVAEAAAFLWGVLADACERDHLLSRLVLLKTVGATMPTGREDKAAARIVGDLRRLAAVADRNAADHRRLRDGDTELAAIADEADERARQLRVLADAVAAGLVMRLDVEAAVGT